MVNNELGTVSRFVRKNFTFSLNIAENISNKYR